MAHPFVVQETDGPVHALVNENHVKLRQRNGEGDGRVLLTGLDLCAGRRGVSERKVLRESTKTRRRQA